MTDKAAGGLYRTILVPLENSKADETILAHIRALARQMGSRLVLVHVADGFAARHQDDLNLEDSAEIREDRAYLERRREELAHEGFNVQVRLAAGEPAEQIVASAAAESCDLIAMATHGHRLVKDIVLGSVANQVRHRTHVPVLLVRVP